jgi:hypothetical protein
MYVPPTTRPHATKAKHGLPITAPISTMLEVRGRVMPALRDVSFHPLHHDQLTARTKVRTSQRCLRRLLHNRRTDHQTGKSGQRSHTLP